MSSSGTRISEVIESKYRRKKPFPQNSVRMANFPGERNPDKRDITVVLIFIIFSSFMIQLSCGYFMVTGILVTMMRQKYCLIKLTTLLGDQALKSTHLLTTCEWIRQNQSFKLALISTCKYKYISSQTATKDNCFLFASNETNSRTSTS